MIYDLLTLEGYKKYGPFSNSSYAGGNGSLEQPHNTVHCMFSILTLMAPG